MTSAAELAAVLTREVAGPLGVTPIDVPVLASHEAADWAASGAHELTGYADGPALASPGAPASTLRAALAVYSAYAQVPHPGLDLLSARARVTGLGRNAPWSVGGAFRALPARDGWLGLTLGRPADLELVPALTEAAAGRDPWDCVSSWLREQDAAAAAARAHLLGLAAATIPSAPVSERRPPVVVTPGGRAVGKPRPLVVDLSSLWAGPLCARLLGAAGCRVVKVESSSRPDGARKGSPRFFADLHEGHEFVRLDLDADRDQLHALLGAADVVIEASRPPALRRLGIDAAHHAARGTRWISITGYGRAREDEMRAGYGDDVAAGAGLVTWARGVPVPVGDAIADPLTGVHAAAAAMIALASGRGCLLDVSMHDVARRAAAATAG